ncbi:hypothetical protein OROMI_005268 [Orobanche minor]
MAFDPIIILFLLLLCLLGEMVKEAIEQDTKLVQAVVDALYLVSLQQRTSMVPSLYCKHLLPNCPEKSRKY